MKKIQVKLVNSVDISPDRFEQFVTEIKESFFGKYNDFHPHMCGDYCYDISGQLRPDRAFVVPRVEEVTRNFLEENRMAIINISFFMDFSDDEPASLIDIRFDKFPPGFQNWLNGFWA